MGKIAGIVLSAGKGTRMLKGAKAEGYTAKQYLPLCGKTVLSYSIEAFLKAGVNDLVIVCSPDDAELVRGIYDESSSGINDVKMPAGDNRRPEIIITAGGAYRFNSVANGLTALEGYGADDIVLIHDGARPFVTPEMIKKLIAEAEVYGGAIASTPMKDTVKIAEDGFIKSTPPRSSLAAVQTPQVFKYDIVKYAYDALIASPDISVTDDAEVVEKYGDCRIKLVDTGYENIKITTPEDMRTAEGFINGRAGSSSDR